LVTKGAIVHLLMDTNPKKKNPHSLTRHGIEHPPSSLEHSLSFPHVSQPFWDVKPYQEISTIDLRDSIDYVLVISLGLASDKLQKHLC